MNKPYLCVKIIMLPQGPELVLTADVPDGELYVLVLQSLHVEADGGDGLDELVLLQLEEDRGLARAIQTQGDNSHLNFWSNVNPTILKYNPRLRFTKLFYHRLIYEQREKDNKKLRQQSFNLSESHQKCFESEKVIVENVQLYSK